jgi:hypothetical protein
MLNLREGMRRLGIVLGILGFIAGGIFSYLQLQVAWSHHTEFERLCSLGVMHEVAKAVTDYRDGWRDVKTVHGPWEKYSASNQPHTAQAREKFPKGFIPDSGQPVSASKGTQLGSADRQVPIPAGAEIEEDTLTAGPLVARRADMTDMLTAADPAAEIVVTVSAIEGIQAVNVDGTGVVTSIQLTTGEWVHREPQTAKTRLTFLGHLLLLLLYPALGFLVPWGTIRTSAWVATGFSRPPTSPST